MQRLFTSDKKEEWTDEARAFDLEATRALRPLIKKAADKGYSLIDLHYVIIMSLTDLTCAQRIGWGEDVTDEPKKQV